MLQSDKLTYEHVSSASYGPGPFMASDLSGAFELSSLPPGTWQLSLCSCEDSRPDTSGAHQVPVIIPLRGEAQVNLEF